MFFVDHKPIRPAYVDQTMDRKRDQTGLCRDKLRQSRTGARQARPRNTAAAAPRKTPTCFWETSVQLDHQFKDMKFNVARDSLTAVLSVATAALTVASGGGLALGLAGGALCMAGPAIKKLAISDDSSGQKRFWLGALSLLFGAGSLINYWIATPGWKSEKALQETRADVAQKHIE
jgi:hypothetical protein